MNSIRDLGQFGGDVIADTDPHDGNWFAISMITDTVIGAWTPAYTVYGTLASITWPAGFLLFGNFGQITLTSGSIVAYRTNNTSQFYSYG
jgi:hypothetical protein